MVIGWDSEWEAPEPLDWVVETPWLLPSDLRWKLQGVKCSQCHAFLNIIIIVVNGDLTRLPW
jgi:hypothetical protein